MKKHFDTTTSSLATYFVMLFIFVLVRILFLHIELPLSENANDIVTTTIVQIVIMFGFSVFLFGLISSTSPRKVFSQFGYHKLGAKAILICLALGFLCYFFNILIAGFFNAIINLFGYESLPSSPSTSDYSVFSFIVQIFTVCLLPAICEETAHRGLLLNGLKGFGIIKALIFSSIMFGLMHLSIQQFFYTAILGFIIGMSVVISGSIFPGIIIHFMNNFLSTYFTFASAKGWIGSDIMKIINSFVYSNPNIFAVFLTIIFVLSIIILIIMLLFIALIKQTRLKKAQEIMSSICTQLDSEKPLDESERLAFIMNNAPIEFGSFFGENYKNKHMSAVQKVWLASIIAMGGFITISTFVWGIL